MKKNVIYMPSTPLNVMVSLAHAAAHKNQQNAYLILIDQKNIESNPYFIALQQSSLFCEVHILPGIAKGRDKWAERQANFTEIKKCCELWRPYEVLVGSDRRVEFQYAMHVCYPWGTVGTYLDDGLYTYAGKPRAWYKDPINSLLKKLAYGFWWKEPSTVGASSWITRAYVFESSAVVDELKNKDLIRLQPNWFTLPDVRDVTVEILRSFNLPDDYELRIAEIDILLTFPHPNDISQLPGYQKRVEGFIQKAITKNLNVAVKYHPRMSNADEWRLKEKFNVDVLPSGLAFEFLLPFLKSKMTVLGDVGTIVMTTKWLRPDLRAKAVLSRDDTYASQFRPVMQVLSIPLIESFDDAIEEGSESV